MVDVKATNVKLHDRACSIVCEACGVDGDRAKAALAQTDYDVKPAILMLLSGKSAAEAQAALGAHDGFLRAVLADGRA